MANGVKFYIGIFLGVVLVGVVAWALTCLAFGVDCGVFSLKNESDQEKSKATTGDKGDDESDSKDETDDEEDGRGDKEYDIHTHDFVEEELDTDEMLELMNLQCEASYDAGYRDVPCDF